MTTRSKGPFDRILKTAPDEPGQDPPERDRSAVYVGGTIIGLAILLLVLYLPPISILSGDGSSASGDIPSGPGTADTYTSTVRSGVPKLPAGLIAASSLFDLAAPEDQRGASGITVPLKEQQTDSRNLALYTYVENKWQRLSDVSLVANGTAVRGEVPALPGNVIVLRRSRATLQVAGFIPAGTDVDERAASAITTLHPIVFIPTDEGGIAGVPPAVPPAAYRVVPGIVAPVPEVVDNILRSSELTQAHVAALAQAVTEGNYSGINVDYRNVNPALKDQYSAFVQQLADALHEDGRTLTVSLPMPEVNAGVVETGAYDWTAVGASADAVHVIGEPDQELYFQRTEAALDYIVERVDRAKVMITITTLSVERGSDGLRSMPLNEALSLASQVAVPNTDPIAAGATVTLTTPNLSPDQGASGLTWDTAARAVTFSYPGRGGRRTVWIANQFSTAFRLELAQRYNLGGVAFTDVSTQGGGADVWTAVQDLSDTGSITLSTPNGELLTPVWQASAGQLAPAHGHQVAWTAPAEPGPYEITVIVSDGVIRAAQRVTIDVIDAAPPPPDEGE